MEDYEKKFAEEQYQDFDSSFWEVRLFFLEAVTILASINTHFDNNLLSILDIFFMIFNIFVSQIDHFKNVDLNTGTIPSDGYQRRWFSLDRRGFERRRL